MRSRCRVPKRTLVDGNAVFAYVIVTHLLITAMRQVLRTRRVYDKDRTNIDDVLPGRGSFGGKGWDRCGGGEETHSREELDVVRPVT